MSLRRGKPTWIPPSSTLLVGTPPNLTNLDGLFTADAGGRTARDWAAIAANLPDREADVATLARIAAGWHAASLVSLSALFAANPGGGNAAQWAAIAGNLPNRMADVAALARIAGWNPANLANLAGLFAANAGGRTGGHWAAIAANLPNREADVATLARIASWNHTKLAHLAGLLAANAGGRTAADWATIAAQLIDREADVAALARIAAWNAANLAHLARLFAANAGGRTAADWATIAAQWIDHEADIATLARVPRWTAADLASLAQNRANYALLKTLITARSNHEKSAALASQALLTILKNSLSWDDFAKCVELLGRKIPDFNNLTANHTMRTSFQQAWQASNASIHPNHGQHEEGGWIYLNIITGGLSVQRQAAGAQAAINLSAPPVHADSVVIAKFHTHPNLGPHWVHGPSGADTHVDALQGVPDVVIAQPRGPAIVTLHFFPSGPASRAHLAGNQGLPGQAGGIAP